MPEFSIEVQEVHDELLELNLAAIMQNPPKRHPWDQYPEEDFDEYTPIDWM